MLPTELEKYHPMIHGVGYRRHSHKPTTELNDSDVYDISINKLCFFLANCKPFVNSGCKYRKRVGSELSLFFLHINEVKAIWSAAEQSDLERVSDVRSLMASLSLRLH